MDNIRFDPFDVTLNEFMPMPVQPLLAIQLMKFTVAPPVTIANEVRSSPSQLAMGPGDLAVIAATEAKINNDVTVAKILDPVEHAETYPDWEERLLNSWVLTSWTSIEDHEDWYLGWFERSRLVPVTTEQSEELQQLFVTYTETHAESIELPEWLRDAISQQLAEVAKTDPDKVARAVTCGSCGARAVELHGLREQRFAAEVGIKVINGEEKYVNTSSPQSDSRLTFHLHCTACEARADLDADEIELE